MDQLVCLGDEDGGFPLRLSKGGARLASPHGTANGLDQCRRYPALEVVAVSALPSGQIVRQCMPSL